MSLETWMVGNGRLGELGDLEAGSVLGMEAVLRMAREAAASEGQVAHYRVAPGMGIICKASADHGKSACGSAVSGC